MTTNSLGSFFRITAKYITTERDMIQGLCLHKEDDSLGSPELELFLVKEQDIGIKPHYHGILPGIRPDTVRARIKKLVEPQGGKGNAAYQVSQIGENHEDLLKLYRYMCKGLGRGELPIVICNTILDKDFISSFHNAYWDINEQILAEKSMSQFEKIFKRFTRNPQMSLVTDVKQHVLEYYLEHDMIIDEQRIYGYIVTYMVKYDIRAKRAFNERLDRRLEIIGL